MQSSRWATPAAAPPPPAEPFTHVEAPAEDMTYQPMTDPLEDQFAQTRGADDLFDDDFTPIAQPSIEEQQVASQDYQPTPQETVPAEALSHGTSTSRHAGPKNAARGSRARGRGRGRGGSDNVAARATEAKPVEPTQPAPATDDTTNAPSATAADQPIEKKDLAVRGDRTATGGNKREKLTDEQLAQKLEAMRLKNAKLTADHERSLQDVAAFTKREAVAAEIAQQKRKEERQNRQAMMGERERNRQHKLNALGRREWDIEKGEGQFERDAEEREGQRGGRARRGAHGAIVGPPTLPSAPADSSELDSPDATQIRQNSDVRGRGRGRGGRGARGGRDSNDRKAQLNTQQVPSATDFPELPTSQQSKAATEFFSPITPGTEKKSWADQVEGTT